ncbi:uncharacterized protein LOC133886884 [Phragmites australis]|uniref:uncharacterized protein LOC133886884 n=1 Tax=Phragmites australis TaxID=29695 RepID=UPI002D76932E|nr:uncharacterized protein LOC133886884 [Phragmites australis]
MRGPFTFEEIAQYASTRGRRRPGTRSQASSSAASPSDHPGAEGAVTGTRVRQSVLYSNHPRRLRRRREPAPTEERPSKVSSGELGRAVTDLPTFEALSLGDPPLLTLQTTEETDDDDASSHLRKPGDLYTISQKGLTRSMLLSLGDSLLTTVSVEELCRTDSDVDSEDLRREIKEYLDTQPSDLQEAFDRVRAVEYATLTALAVERGTEPPWDPFLVDQEILSLQAPQQASAVTAQAPRKPRCEDGKDWMRDEVMLCFEKHIEKNAYLKPLEYKLDELCHQCFNAESYNNVFHHYNFTIMMKMPNSVDWTVELYFAEVKEMFRRKFYFCCPLEPNENGHCYACKSKGVEDLKHPTTGGFVGSPNAPESNFWYSDEDDDDEEARNYLIDDDDEAGNYLIRLFEA